VKVSTEDVIQLLSLSNYSGVEPLKESCGELLGSQLTGDSLFYLLDICEKFACTNLKKMCAEYLAENFGDLLEADKLMDLDAETWTEMLKSDEIKVTSEEEIFKAVIRYANQHRDKRDLILEQVLPSIRFPLLPTKFLVEKVEGDLTLQHLPCLHKLLHETYRYKAYPASVTSFRTKMRKGTHWFDTTSLPGGVVASDENRTVSVQGNGAQLRTIKALPSFDEGVSYREFKVVQMSTSGLWIGVAHDGVIPITGYPGQVANSWGYEGTGGQLYQSGALTPIPGGTYSSGDRVGILCVPGDQKLELYKNGKMMYSVTNFNVGKSKVFPYVALYTVGDSVTILATSGPS